MLSSLFRNNLLKSAILAFYATTKAEWNAKNWNMKQQRYNQQQIESFAQAVLNDGYCVLRDHLSTATLKVWREAFAPLLHDHIEREGKLRNRGPARYYVTLLSTLPLPIPVFMKMRMC